MLAELAPSDLDIERLRWADAKDLKLDVGAGQYKRDEDFVSVDLFDESADVRAAAHEMPFPDGSVELVWCSHMLEHVPRGEINRVLQEFLRVLKPGGRAIISVPNFDYVARYWLTGPDRAWAEAMVYGLQTQDGEYHRTAFTHETLRGDVTAAGFEVVRVELRWTHNQETLQCTARKPSG